MTETLPTPTTDVSRCVADLESHGYCYLDAALGDAALTRVQQRLTEQAQAEEQQGFAYKDGGPGQNWGDFRNQHGALRPAAFSESAGGRNQRLWMLVNKGQVFIELLQHARMRQIIGAVLGEEYL
ncbi:MAG TPA: hypothetical protein EYQ32_03885, partial [Gammaproteobacteria bacterium]|nr:hypothetical protein [Gammaproteobacteria bacterium]